MMVTVAFDPDPESEPDDEHPDISTPEMASTATAPTTVLLFISLLGK
jgi:hypothetical protein